LESVGRTSDVLQAGDAFYVVELTSITPSRPLTLEEATPQIEESLRKSAAAKALKDAADKSIASLRQAVASGKSFSEAATALGLKVELLEKALAMSESLPPEQRRAVATTLGLKDGEISGFEPTATGGICVYLKARAPLEDKALEARRNEIRKSLLENKKDILFAEWIRSSREAAKITTPQR